MVTSVRPNFFPEDKDISSSLIAALDSSPELLTHFNNVYETWQARGAHDGIDPITAKVVMLASDGFWFSRVFKVPAIEPKIQQAILEQLLSLLKKRS